MSPMRSVPFIFYYNNLYASVVLKAFTVSVTPQVKSSLSPRGAAGGRAQDATVATTARSTALPPIRLNQGTKEAQSSPLIKLRSGGCDGEGAQREGGPSRRKSAVMLPDSSGEPPSQEAAAGFRSPRSDQQNLSSPRGAHGEAARVSQKSSSLASPPATDRRSLTTSGRPITELSLSASSSGDCSDAEYINSDLLLLLPPLSSPKTSSVGCDRHLRHERYRRASTTSCDEPSPPSVGPPSPPREGAGGSRFRRSSVQMLEAAVTDVSPRQNFSRFRQSKSVDIPDGMQVDKYKKP